MYFPQQANWSTALHCKRLSCLHTFPRTQENYYVVLPYKNINLLFIDVLQTQAISEDW